MNLGEVERIGERLFGRGLRLRVALYLVDAEELQFQGGVARALDASATEVGKELDRLADLGMLQKLPRLRGNDRQNYLRQEHWLWEVLATVAERLSAGLPADG